MARASTLILENGGNGIPNHELEELFQRPHVANEIKRGGWCGQDIFGGE